MDSLKIKVELKDHPYRTAPGANLEAWGNISLDILSGANVERLVQTEWDVLCLAEWYIDNKAVIEGEDFLILGKKQIRVRVFRRLYTGYVSRNSICPGKSPKMSLKKRWKSMRLTTKDIHHTGIC